VTASPSGECVYVSRHRSVTWRYNARFTDKRYQSLMYKFSFVMISNVSTMCSF